jgi:hypothetical protein
LAAANRRLLALHTGWPDGAVEDCEDLEAKTPGWGISWSGGGNRTWIEPGYYATRVDWHVTDTEPRYLHAATVDELAAAIELHPLPERGPAEFHPVVITGKD